jgi:hypothetical protein
MIHVKSETARALEPPAIPISARFRLPSGFMLAPNDRGCAMAAALSRLGDFDLHGVILETTCNEKGIRAHGTETPRKRFLCVLHRR